MTSTLFTDTSIAPDTQANLSATGGRFTQAASSADGTHATGIAYFCFIVAALAALTGMGLGLRMGMAQDFTLAPMHAHLNLLGWVTMALYGLYYRSSANSRRLAWVQVGIAALGFPAMTGGLALEFSLAGESVWLRLATPLLIAGTLLTIGSMLLFLIVLVRDARALRSASRSTS